MQAVMRNKYVAKCRSRALSAVRWGPKFDVSRARGMHLACANSHACRHAHAPASGRADRLVIINMSSLSRCAPCARRFGTRRRHRVACASVACVRLLFTPPCIFSNIVHVRAFAQGDRYTRIHEQFWVDGLSLCINFVVCNGMHARARARLR